MPKYVFPSVHLTMPDKEFYIGCSGYYYPQWKNIFYPGEMAQSKWLSHYSKIFNSVELNGTFYRTPSVASLKKSAQQTPDDFKFSAKMSRYVTHMVKLKDSAARVKEFADLLHNGLGFKFDKLLFQLPPGFHYNEENVERIIENIPHDARNVIEFRHISWWENEIHRKLKKYKYTLCNIDFPGLQPPFISSGKHFYLRLHGSPELFISSYTHERLKKFSAKIPTGCEIFNIYFNNTNGGAAFKNAVEFKKLIAGRFT